VGQRPLIGLDCGYERDEKNLSDQIRMYVAYYEALITPGALPVVMPVVDDRALLSEYLDVLDGLVFTGGLDVPPGAYGQEKHPQTQECHSRRFAHDKLLAELVLQRDIPVLAICLGQQVINVVYGGTLIQHIETELEHTRLQPGLDSFHPVTVEEDSMLYQILGANEVEVNSSHHQAVDKPAPGLRVLARAPDGTIEAVQMTDKRFFLGVQWHPERLRDRPEQQALFKAFVAAASDRGS
jgi:gamma-glutamyl-gamma-aminobutyrate hydrolase PuuD